MKVSDMWPFRQRQRVTSDSIVKEFTKGLSDQVVAGLRGETPAPTELVYGNVRFVMVRLRDDILSDVPKYLAKIFEAAQHSEGMVDAVMSPFVVITFSFPERNGESAEKCVSLIE